MIAGRAWIVGAPALVALMQMSAPVAPAATFMLVPICGEFNGHAVPIRLPGKTDEPGGAACCKICHSAMRKKIENDSGCGGEDDNDAA